MNYIDIILGILLILAAVNGFRKGFVVEVASLVALILGVWGAINFSYIASDYLTQNFDMSSSNLGIVSFLITFVIIVILVHLLGKLIDRFLKIAQLSFLNRLAGLFFCIVKTALILSVVLIVFDVFNDYARIIPDETKEESRTYEPIKMLVPTIFPFVKAWTNDNISKEENNSANNSTTEV